MPEIYLQTQIQADIKIVFDLARSIDLHKISTAHTKEEAIGGKTSGLISLHETVTWRAKHFGVWQKLTSKITGFESPNYFADEMEQGTFKRFKHEHFFTEKDGLTLMKDIFDYDAPLGILGKLADVMFLEKYMRELLEKRNETIKNYAESNKWQTVLKI
ncbi:SRPBCC family protein [Maribacter sp.]|nr:SRPBCC family protein [Maribacter sp.]